MFQKSFQFFNQKNLCNYSNIAKVKFLKKPIDPQVTKVFQKYEKSIVYSSYIEDHFLKLKYKESRALQEIIDNKEKQLRIENAKLKTFPLALKYVAEDRAYEEVTNSEYKSTFSKEEEKLLESIRKKEMNKIQFQDELQENQPNWLNDYEYFDEDEKTDGKYGTPDPLAPASQVPCNGCGAQLHCVEPGLAGYLPSEIFKGRTNAELKTMTCQRCHFLKNYSTALNVKVHPDEYLQMISSISHKVGLAIVIVDLLDFPSSIWPDIHNIIGERRPVFVVGNKVDLIPKDSRDYLNNIKNRLMEQVIKEGLLEKNIKHVALVSATTGYGIEELITNLHHKWGTRGDVYLTGATNVGKSSLFNALLRSDYCKIQAQDLVDRATASPWPGTTLRLLKFPILRPSDYRIFVRTQRLIMEQHAKRKEDKLRRVQANLTGEVEYATPTGHIGLTFKPEPKEVQDSFTMGKPNIQPSVLSDDNKIYRDSKWCYDTPGIILPHQIHHKLNIEEILLAMPKEMLRPRAFFIKLGTSLFLAGIGRIDYVSGTHPVRFLVYSSLKLPILICDTMEANEIYADLLSTDVLQVPQNAIERPKPWTGLECEKEFSLTVNCSSSQTVADIVFASIGWVGVNGNRTDDIAFRVWSPNGQGIFLRQPALLPDGFRLRGKRIHDSVAHKIGKAFIKQ